jgi:hypothetical protein
MDSFARVGKRDMDSFARVSKRVSRNLLLSNKSSELLEIDRNTIVELVAILAAIERSAKVLHGA